MPTPASTAQDELMAQVLDPANRHDPYPLYAQLRQKPVTRQSDGTYVVARFDDLRALLQDPRISSDDRKSAAGAQGVDRQTEPPFIFLDPPEHDKIRHAVMRVFSVQLVNGLTDEVHAVTKRLLDATAEKKRLDLVADFAYPLPVSVICTILGVPFEDEKLFQGWSATVARGLDPGLSDDEVHRIDEAGEHLNEYLSKLAADRIQNPGDDLVSKLVTGGPGAPPMRDQELYINLRLLLIAGHETTVNLITNGMLTLLRRPDVLDRLRNEPWIVANMVEELLRFEPPVQFRTRTALADIDIEGTVIPKGAPIVLLLAAGSRDPAHLDDPDEFVPDRPDIQHLGFGGGAHYCVGAPLARMEARVALVELARRLQNPRLVEDPPPYHEQASLRGPARLLVDVDGVSS